MKRSVLRTPRTGVQWSADNRVFMAAENVEDDWWFVVFTPVRPSAGLRTVNARFLSEAPHRERLKLLRD